MNRNLTWLSGIGLGAGLMYLLDPDRGPRRRAVMREVDNQLEEHKTADGVPSLQGSGAHRRSL